MLNNKSLRIIQSGTDDDVYTTVTEMALYMASGGFLKHANELLTALWKYNLVHDRKTWLADRAFMMFWHISGLRPEFVPFEVIDIDLLERYQRGYVAIDKWGYEMPDVEWKQMKGTDLLRKANQLAGLVKNHSEPSITLEMIRNISSGNEKITDIPEGETSFSVFQGMLQKYVTQQSVKDDDMLPSDEKELEALEALRKFSDDGGISDEGFVLATELAGKHNRKEEALYFLETWTEKFIDSSLRLSVMCCNRHVVPLLLDYCITDELGLTEQLSDKFLKDAKITLDQRMQNGSSLVYGKLNWRKLIEKLSELSIVYSTESFTPEVCAEKWIGFQPAAEEDIINIERRLGITLPEDYKDFLRTTNGIRAFPIVNPELLPVKEIDYLRNIENPDLFKLLQCYPVDEEDPETFADYTNRCILISKYPDEQMIWLIPPKDQNGSWQTWFFANWNPGETRYPGFRYFIEHAIQSIDES